MSNPETETQSQDAIPAPAAPQPIPASVALEASEQGEPIATPTPPKTLQSNTGNQGESTDQALSKPPSGMHPKSSRPRRRKRKSSSKTKTQSQLGSWLGGEGGQAPKVSESGTNPPHKPNKFSKGFCMSELGDIGGASPEFYNSLVGLIDRRIAAFKAAEGIGMAPVLEEVAQRFKEEYRPLVWAGDPEDTIELRVTGRPRNERARLVEVDGEVRNVWFPSGYPPMVGLPIACRPSDDPDRPGYILVGTYGRKGGRIQ